MSGTGMKCPGCGTMLRATYCTGGKNIKKIPFMYCEACAKFYSIELKEA